MGDKTINEYIEDLKNGKDTAERAYKVRKSIMDRASAAYSKAQTVEAALKAYWDRVVATRQMVATIGTSVVNAMTTGVTVVGNTDKARQAVEFLTYEIQDIACQAEAITNQIKDFQKAVEAKIGKDKPALACIDEVLKTLPDVSTHAFAGLDKSLALIKTINYVQTSLEGKCGVNSRLLELTEKMVDCGFKDEIGTIDAAWVEKYKCEIPIEVTSEDPKCGDKYATYNAKVSPSYDGCDLQKNFCNYINKTETNYKDAMDKSIAALDWFNCATAQKNAAEATFNACKAAYEAALQAKKC